MKSVANKLIFMQVLMTFFTTWQTQAEAGKDVLTLSKTFSISWPKDIRLQMTYLPSLNGFWFQGFDSGKSFSVWTSYQKPLILANNFSVKRLWRDNLKNLKLLGDRATDKGCARVNSYEFRCVRLGLASDGKYMAETLVWNAKQDLVIVRVASHTSQRHAQSILNKIKFNPTNRLPAGLSK